MRKRLIIGLGVLMVLTVGVGFAFASDSSPEKEPVSSPFFEATLDQAVSELDGQARAPEAGAARAPGAPLPPFTSSPDAFPECFTQASAYFPMCHFTTDPQWPECAEPYPTKDYTWDPSLWKECGPEYTKDPAAPYCDPRFTLDPTGAVSMCDPAYTRDPAGAAGDPWCNPMYTWDAAQWPSQCPVDGLNYTAVAGTWPECEGSQEYTLDPYRWRECHFTSDSLVWAQCVPPFPTQDYTSSPTQWAWCPGPDYTTEQQGWPWCNPEFTSTPNQPPCENYTSDSQVFPWCADPYFTTDPDLWPECHYTSAPARWPECEDSWPTKDYTRDPDIWSNCDTFTQDPATTWQCMPNPDYTYVTDLWPWCDPNWTWDASSWPECAPGYTYQPGQTACEGGAPYTSAPQLWPECNNHTADARVWPECHYTSDPVLWSECGEGQPYATKDYTTDPQLWPECDTPEPVGELGDAPDRTNHFGANMTAFPAVNARYPTVFDPATGLPQGPKHWKPKTDAWLGPNVSREKDADQNPDEDPVTNIGPPGDNPDRDRYDDGVSVPLALPDCITTTFEYTVTVPGGAPSINRFVNVWFDWNRDGDWLDTPVCKDIGPAPEWAVQDAVIAAGTAPGVYIFTTPIFLTWNPPGFNPPETWMRISIADRPAPQIVGTNLADGRGPTSGYAYGETEDYFFEPTCPKPVADFDWDPANICPGTTVYFWDQSTGPPTTWAWDFDDGSAVSTDQNPTHVFASIGTYDVTLRITNPCGGDSITKKVEVVDCPDDQEDYDIWIKDNDTDDGSVPSSTPWYVGTDIWVRNADDNGTDHQDPIPGTTNYIYVRVRNRLTTTVDDITTNVYWANAALSTGWPGSWSFVDSFFVPSLAGGAVTVKSLPWNTPYSNGHFCLRARLDAPKDPVDSGPDTTPVVTHPSKNNNIAQVNVNSVRFPEVKECGFYTSTVYTDVVYFDVYNAKSSATKVDIIIDSSDFPLAGGGTIMLDPGSLWGEWDSLTDFTAVSPTLTVAGFPASMNDVDMGPGETVRMTMTIAAEIDDSFTIDVTQEEGGVEAGGIQYVRDLPRCIYLPVIMKDTTP